MPSLDLNVIARQSFGVHFERTEGDERLAQALLDGELTMRPHPTWALPRSLNWDEDPFGQRNWVAQLHMLRWLDPLRRVAQTGNEPARALWLDYVRSWVESNPMGNGQCRYAWSDMIDGIRALELTFGFALAPRQDNTWLYDSIVQHGEWLADEANLGHSNHALHQHQGLFVLASALHHEEWRRLSIERHDALLEKSYDEQGMNDEGAVAYHRANVVWWNRALQRFDFEGVSRPPAARRLEMAAYGLAHATRPDGTLERIGDTDPERPTGVASPYLDYILSGGALGKPPESRTAVFDRGYVFGRSGWGEFERDFVDESFYSVSFGPANRVHGHQDGGAVTYFASRVPWLIDSGKYGYISNDPMRAYVLSRAAHNVVTIRGRKYDAKAVVSLDKEFVGDDLDDFTFTDRGYQGVNLTRRVVYSKGGDFLIVIDTVRSTSPIIAEQLWHLPPEVRAARANKGFALTSGSRKALITWAGKVPRLRVARGETEPLQGWVSPTWGVKQPSQTIVASHEGDRFRFITVIGSATKGSFSLDLLRSGPFGIVASVTSGRSQYHVHLDRDESSIRVGAAPEWFAEGTSAPVSDMYALLRDLPDEVDAENVPDDLDPRLRVAHVRSRAHSAGGDRAVRLGLVKLLAEREDLPHVPDADHGVRAAIIDLLGPDLMTELGVTSEGIGLNRHPLIQWQKSVPLSHARYEVSVRPSGEFVSQRGSGLGTPTILVHEEAGLVMPFMARNGQSDALIVRFHGALVRSRTQLPIFQWFTTDVRSDHAFMTFQDPMLDLDRTMTLSWFLGTPELNLFDRIAQLVTHAATTMGKEHVLLTGSSGGGFVALQVASRLPGSMALVFNPQTDVRAYFPDMAAKALTNCGLVDVAGDVPAGLRSRVSFLERLREAPFESHVTYVQNSGDAHHARAHLSPLRRIVEGDARLRERFEFTDVLWGKGHVSPKADDYAAFIEKSLARVRSRR